MCSFRGSTRAKRCSTSTSRSSKPSTRSYASSWASGTRHRKWFATWWPGWIRRSKTISASRPCWRLRTSTCWTRAVAPARIWRKCSAAFARNLGKQGLGALAGEAVRQAATSVCSGSRSCPAPFVVAHLQVGLTMEKLDAPLADDGSERAGVFLTNALTGWAATARPDPVGSIPRIKGRARSRGVGEAGHSDSGDPRQPFPKRDLRAWRWTEERELSEAYRTTKQCVGRRARASTISTFGSTGWPNGASRRRAAGSSLLHLQLFLARWVVLHRDAGALPRSVRRDPHRLPKRRQVQDR